MEKIAYLKVNETTFRHQKFMMTLVISGFLIQGRWRNQFWQKGQSIFLFIFNIPFQYFFNNADGFIKAFSEPFTKEYRKIIIESE